MSGDGYEVGVGAASRWRVGGSAVDLTRPAAAPRPATLDCEEARVTFDLAATAMVVVDMQNAFCHPDRAGGEDAPARRPIAPLKTLLPDLRRAGVPVIWVNWGNRPDGANLAAPVVYCFRGGGARQSFIVKDSFEAAIVGDLDPDPADLRFDKHRISGFWDNGLDTALRNMGATTLLFAGVNLDQCVYATLMDASFLGYAPILLRDCCATSSPGFCTEATLHNVRQVYGFVSDSGALRAALAG